MEFDNNAVDLSFLAEEVPQTNLFSCDLHVKVLPTGRTGACLFTCSALSHMSSSELCDYTCAPRHANGVACSEERAAIERVQAQTAAEPYLAWLESHHGLKGQLFSFFLTCAFL